MFGLESFCKHSIPRWCPCPLIHLLNFLGCEHMEHKQIECSFYFAHHGILRMSTPSPCLKEGTWWGFGHEWNEILESFPWLKKSNTNSSTKRIQILKTFIIEQKPKMQYLHGSFKIDVVTWNSHCNTDIMI